MDRHFCVTVYVVDESKERFLLIKHKKLGKWLPPGGHIDPNEMPCEAGEREVWEETGVKISLKNPEPGFPGEMAPPLGLQRNIIVEGQHEHMDLIYTAVAQTEALTVNEEETDGIAWVEVPTILDESFNTFPSVKTWVRRIAGISRD